MICAKERAICKEEEMNKKSSICRNRSCNGTGKDGQGERAAVDDEEEEGDDTDGDDGDNQDRAEDEAETGSTSVSALEFVLILLCLVRIWAILLSLGMILVFSTLPRYMQHRSAESTLP